jgi:cytochrome c556
MKKSVALALLLGILLGSAPQDKKKGPKNKEVQKTYNALMTEVGQENKAIAKDMEEKKGDAAIKARLGKIKKNVEAASKLDYMEGTEEDVDKFKRMFGIFLDIRMKSFLEATWDAETGEKLYERLQASCRTCHELFRDE